MLKGLARSQRAGLQFRCQIDQHPRHPEHKGWLRMRRCTCPAGPLPPLDQLAARLTREFGAPSSPTRAERPSGTGPDRRHGHPPRHGGDGPAQARRLPEAGRARPSDRDGGGVGPDLGRRRHRRGVGRRRNQRDGADHKSWRGTDVASIEKRLPCSTATRPPARWPVPSARTFPVHRLVGEKRTKRRWTSSTRRTPCPTSRGTSATTSACITARVWITTTQWRSVRSRGSLPTTAGRRTGSGGPDDGETEARAAVIGAGPAGFASAYFSGPERFPVTVFEKPTPRRGRESTSIPQFRLPAGGHRKGHPVHRGSRGEFRFGASDRFDVPASRAGVQYVLIAVGADRAIA